MNPWDVDHLETTQESRSGQSDAHLNSLDILVAPTSKTHVSPSTSTGVSSDHHRVSHNNDHFGESHIEGDQSSEFTYPESQTGDDPSSEEEFRYIVSPMEPMHLESSTQNRASNDISQPSPAQLEAIFSAASSGDLQTLQKLFRVARNEHEMEAFSLANNANFRTGLTPLHVAASRGHLSIIRWLIEDCGAMADLEDKEGETALHKATLHGHLNIVMYLLSISMGKADVHARDADGWTPLHNACSKGYLDIVRWLCEEGGAAEIPPVSSGGSARGIDRRSAGGWTPLMNAASQGHLPVVLYLLTKQSANPLIRNNWGETAYDVAAAVFEVWVCEILQRAEEDQWNRSPARYNPLAVHTIVPLIVYENQRLDNRFKTLASSGGRPKFSTSGLGRRGSRSPFELRILLGSEPQGQQYIPAWRSDVQLPSAEDPFLLPAPQTSKDTNFREGAERSHFWLSDWTLDTTHPKVDVRDGWQYSRSFDDPDDQWSADMPPVLERLMSRSVILATELDGSLSSGSQLSWVRRRRWVRITRRRLDRPPLPFLEPDGEMYQITSTGDLVPLMQADALDLDGDQGTYSSLKQDYVDRARYLAGSQHNNDLESVPSPATVADARKAIVTLERAVLELRSDDEDVERKAQAEILLNVYNRGLERRRLAAGTSGLHHVEESQVQGDRDDDSDDSFHYPTSPASTPRPSSVRSHVVDDFPGASSTTPTDLTPQLAQAPEFRVPTHEAPQKLTPQATPTPHSIHAQWERDEVVTSCRNCNRKFTFLFRKHCRRCGRIFCDRCSSHRSMLDPTDVVQGPMPVEASSSSSLHRVCDSCYEMTNGNVPGRFQGLRTASMERVFVDQGRLAVPNSSRGDVSSQISDLSDCPVCGQNLAELGPPERQEAHVKSCLEGSGNSASQQAGKYLVYMLPGESALIGVECVICLEEFLQGSLIARLSCLCTFHNACLSAWLQRRGRHCPVHARDT